MKDSIGFDNLYTQLVITNRLLAAQLRSTMKQSDLIELLCTSGATTREIAAILNVAPNTVAVAVHRLKKNTEGSLKYAGNGR